MIEFFKKHKTAILIVLVVLLIIAVITKLVNDRRAEAEAKRRQEEYTKQLMEEAQKGQDDETTDGPSDTLLMQMQPELEATYGKVPDGFIWESDGTVLSLGDKDMTAEEVVYAYFRALSNLDMSTVERYSRDSMVVETYSGYFDEKNKNTDYMDQFLRNMYKQCLLSIQIGGIENQSVFAENKQVFTVSAKMLDLTNKDFWKPDQMEIYKNLYLYDSDESDSTKSDMYLYDYILDYYESEDAELRETTFDVTVQRYPDLDSGWLVSVDTDVNDACSYKDGKLVVSYIKELYSNDGKDLVLEDLFGEEVN